MAITAKSFMEGFKARYLNVENKNRLVKSIKKTAEWLLVFLILAMGFVVVVGGYALYIDLVVSPIIEAHSHHFDLYQFGDVMRYTSLQVFVYLVCSVFYALIWWVIFNAKQIFKFIKQWAEDTANWNGSHETLKLELKRKSEDDDS